VNAAVRVSIALAAFEERQVSFIVVVAAAAAAAVPRQWTTRAAC